MGALPENKVQVKENEMSNKEDNPFRWWVLTSQHFPGSSPTRIRVLRSDGSVGYAIAEFEMHPDDGFTQERWRDINGTIHSRNYYLAWAYLKKDGGMVTITGRRNQ